MGQAHALGPEALRKLARLVSGVRLIAAVSPINYDDEVARLLACRRAGKRLAPRFVYADRPELGPLADELERLSEGLAAAGPELSGIASRVSQSALEARIGAMAGKAGMARLARQRFASTSRDDERARGYASLERREGDDEVRVRSDDENDPRSLLSTLRRLLGAMRLPFAAQAVGGLAPLAATADGVVLVAKGRLVTERDVRRTALHEIEGHVLPMLERRLLGPAGALRPAFDHDREEGRALVLERRAGFLDEGRKRELGLRHEASRLAHDEASMGEVVERLERLGASPEVAVRMAARALRGGGLGRERVYLPWLFRLDPQA